MAKREFARRDQFMMVEIGLEQLARILHQRFFRRHTPFEARLRRGVAAFAAFFERRQETSGAEDHEVRPGVRRLESQLHSHIAGLRVRHQRRALQTKRPAER